MWTDFQGPGQGQSRPPERVIHMICDLLRPTQYRRNTYLLSQKTRARIPAGSLIFLLIAIGRGLVLSGLADSP